MIGADERDPSAIPYVLDVTAVEGPGGDWLCRVAYEDIPGCAVEHRNILVALEQLDRLLDRHLAEAQG